MFKKHVWKYGKPQKAFELSSVRNAFSKIRLINQKFAPADLRSFSVVELRGNKIITVISAEH